MAHRKSGPALRNDKQKRKQEAELQSEQDKKAKTSEES